MNFNAILSKLFGTKSQRDLKEIMPYILKIQEIYPSIEKLSNNDLRFRLQEIRTEILASVEKEHNRIEEIRTEIEKTEINERENFWNEIYKIEKEIT